MTTASLAYRKNRADIWNGKLPEKYRRILPFITGKRILEIGAAEGVLALAKADQDPSAQVLALEMSHDRHLSALLLQERWRSLCKHVGGCSMLLGDIRNQLDLLEGVETLVAVRTIYHLGEHIDPVFQVAAQHVSRVVLCGNPNRAKWPDSSPKAAEQGDFNLYAGVPGMRAVLERHGFTVAQVVSEGDPIVIGCR